MNPTNPSINNSNTNTVTSITNPMGTTGLGTTSAYGSGYGSGSYGGYGSSYGGIGGYGSLGSSYGGYGSMYGGYGSSYGMGGYGSYGMGGYGRMGMMAGGDPNKPNMVMNTLMTLESLGFLIGSFCEIGKSLDHNI
jgi:peroxin-13